MRSVPVYTSSMPENPSYLHLREEALKLNDTAGEYSLCKAIRGGCCKRDVTMLIEDQQVILEAIVRGDIDAPTLQRARRRALDEHEAFCPFLGDGGECTIYAFRPVLCIQHGNGGLPADKPTALKAMRKPGNRTIRVADLEPFSCDACAAQIDPNTRIPLSVAGKSVAILITLQEGERHYGRPRMNSFVIEQIPASD